MIDRIFDGGLPSPRQAADGLLTLARHEFRSRPSNIKSRTPFRPLTNREASSAARNKSGLQTTAASVRRCPGRTRVVVLFRVEEFGLRLGLGRGEVNLPPPPKQRY